MIKISIIVPVYNIEAYLKKCLDSLINQTLQDIEIICVNDGSTDSSLDILKEYQNKDSRIKIIEQKNSGLCTTRNNGVKIAVGEYIGFVDSDDSVDLDFYEKLYDAAKRNKADVACAGIIRENNEKRKVLINYKEENIYETTREKYKAAYIPQYCFVWNKIYSRKIIQESGISFIEGRTYEDMVYTPDIIEYADKMVTVPNIFYHYFIRKNSIIKTDSDKKRADKLLSHKYLVQKCREHNIFSNKDILTRKEEYYFFGVKVLKIYHYQATKKYYLFGLIHFLTKKEMV